MRPIRSFLLLLIFLACFTGLYYIIPANRYFPSVAEFIPSKIISYFKSENKESPLRLSVPQADTTHASVPVLKLPVDSTLILNDPIQEFIDSLNFSKRQVRIMYYGDSQIEGDRITSTLRMNLRKGRSGTGPGLFLPLMPVMYTKTMWLKSSANWKKFNYLSYKSGEISHKSLGPFMALCRYLPDGEKAREIQKAYVRIRPSNIADSLAAVYDYLRIFYGNSNGVVTVNVKDDNNEIITDTLKRDAGLNEFTCRLNGGKDILIEFTGKVSPDIYGISIESQHGVIVDNIPQRGSAGLEFTMVDRENLNESFKKLAPDLIILHYGLNIVKNVRDDYSYYEKGLKRQLALLSEISPGSKLLVISLTDMASKEGDSIKSYPNIPSIIDAQKKAAAEEGAAFWDSYTAMGGESSIVKWGEKKPSLAQNDYVHFTYPGADSLSEILTKAIFKGKVKDTIGSVKYFPGADTLTLNVVQQVDNHPEGRENLAETILSSLLSYDENNPLIFSTASFWLFFLIVLAGYSIIYKKLFIRNFYLFLISLFFYYKSGGILLFLLIFVTLIDFTCGLLIFRAKTRYMKRLIVLFSLISNLGILAYFKYTGFFVSTVNDLLGTNYQVYDFLASFSNIHLGTSFNITEIILPVGVSFFTFQSLSYTFDVYRSRIEPVRNIIDFGFYV
jgi:hypothetical protein